MTAQTDHFHMPAPVTNNWNVQNAPRHTVSVDAAQAAYAAWNQGGYQQIAQRPPHVPAPATEFRNQNMQVITQASPSHDLTIAQFAFPNAQESNQSQSESRHRDGPQDSSEEAEEEETDEDGDKLVLCVQYYVACCLMFLQLRRVL